jgi:hypothetical protein
MENTTVSFFNNDIKILRKNGAILSRVYLETQDQINNPQGAVDVKSLKRKNARVANQYLENATIYNLTPELVKIAQNPTPDKKSIIEEAKNSNLNLYVSALKDLNDVFTKETFDSIIDKKCIGNVNCVDIIQKIVNDLSINKELHVIYTEFQTLANKISGITGIKPSIKGGSRLPKQQYALPYW